MKNITFFGKVLLMLLLMAVASPKAKAHELYSSGSFPQNPGIATQVGDFAYFFYTSYDFGGQRYNHTATMAMYLGESGDAVLPSKVAAPDGQEFEVIGIDYRFQMPQNHNKCTHLTIPNTVMVIEEGAFNDIDQITHLTFEDGAGAINMEEGAQFRAYDNANGNLRTIYLGRDLDIDVDGYQKDNFYNRKISNVTIGNLVTNIPEKLFYNNPFANITFNAGTGPLSIGKEAFVGDSNSSLTTLVIPTPVSFIGEEAFYDNTNLITLSLKTTADALISKNAFDNCEALSTVMVDLTGNMSGSQAKDCFEEDVYSNATLKYNASDTELVAANEPWKSFTRKDGSYNNQITFNYNGIAYILTQGNDGIFRYQDANGNLQTFPLKDDVAINAPVDFVANVSYDRVITGEKWGTTIYLPFAAAKPANWKLYTLPIAQTSTTGKITLTEVETETIEPFTPYIVNPQPENPTTTYSYTFPTQEATILAGNKETDFVFSTYKVPSITFAKAFKLEDTEEEATADNISGKKIIPDTERETSAIDNATLIDNSKTTNDNAWYTLDGQRLTSKPSKKGIYINGGRKIAVK